MKVVVAAVAWVGLAVAPAMALPMDHSCIGAGSGPARLAAIVGKPQDCCTGRMQCAQFLSTTRLVHPASRQPT